MGVARPSFACTRLSLRLLYLHNCGRDLSAPFVLLPVRILSSCEVFHAAIPVRCWTGRVEATMRAVARAWLCLVKPAHYLSYSVRPFPCGPCLPWLTISNHGKHRPHRRNPPPIAKRAPPLCHLWIDPVGMVSLFIRVHPRSSAVDTLGLRPCLLQVTAGRQPSSLKMRIHNTGALIGS